MARIRSVKPEIASDAKLAKASRDARYTFVLMITQADDVGLLPGAHRQLLGILYPLDDSVTAAMVLGWVEELVGIGLVRWRSTRDGTPVIELVNWSKHQRIDNAGRSQLAPLLVPLSQEPENQPDPPPLPPRADTGAPDPAEVRGESRRVAAVRGLDLGPRTMDLGEGAVGDGGAGASRFAVKLAVAMNAGIAENGKWPAPVTPINGSSGASLEAAEAVIAAGVEEEFACRSFFTVGKRATSDRPPTSLKYGVRATVDAWQREQTRKAGDGLPPPVELPAAPRGFSSAGELAAQMAGIEQWKRQQRAKESA